ncbi:histidine kinase [Metabacillus halosaccharovorans]|uniref:sensor histidine kinase n=1 Tax=Metabacillus halosaccharovorans TaxID=930124 RepID=UPI00203B98E5|nr:histidine kinase [Metabacillus halosaccharovorans]MCM3440562.1 sensor histidine kinase [Metabacillus halosaccharovorans]
MKKTSIRNKLIVLLLLITIVPFGTSIVITYFYTKESLKDEFVAENVNLLYQGKLNIEGYIGELKNLTLSFYNNIDFMRYMKNNPDFDKDYLAKESFKNVILTILYAEENINRVNIALIDDHHNISVSKKSAVVFSRLNQNLNQDMYEKALNNPYRIHIEPMEVLQEENISEKSNRRNDLFTLHRALIDVPSDDLLGYISLEINSEHLLGIAEKLYVKDKEEFYLLSPEGELIFRSNNDVDENQQWIASLIKNNKPNGMMEWKKDSFHGLMIYETLDESSGGWIMVKRIPYTSVFESALSVAKINILFGVIGLILVIMATLFVSFKITSPIRVLLQNIKQVENGNMNVQFDSLGNDEIGTLGERFKEMIAKINHLINREYKLEIENKTNQLKALQSQLNPHFLYNALQSIGTLALKNNVPQVYTLVTHLSKIMRYGMNIDEDLVPLTKEIDYTKAFLLLQKERFGDQFEYTLSFDKEDSFITVPKMILQPIIENYFKHGFDRSNDKIGHLTIIVRRDQGQLVMTVQDNGNGITETRLNEIYQTLNKDQQSKLGGENIGLRNVYLRLKLYFGEKASLLIENNEDGGTFVTIKLPVETGGSGNESNHN